MMYGVNVDELQEGFEIPICVDGKKMTKTVKKIKVSRLERDFMPATIPI
jgi:hypothetical protein